MPPNPATTWTSKASQPGACSTCGKAVAIGFAQTAADGALAWSWHAHCVSCGGGPGDSGTGIAPGEIRRMIFASEGSWSVVPYDRSRAAIPVIKAIRSVFGLGLAEAKARWDAGDLKGTRAECVAMATLMGREGVEAEVVGADERIVSDAGPETVAFTGATASITVRDASTRPISAIKAIRAALNLGLKEAKDRWDGRGPGNLLRGTPAEVIALARAFRAEGFEKIETQPGELDRD